MHIHIRTYTIACMINFKHSTYICMYMYVHACMYYQCLLAVVQFGVEVRLSQFTLTKVVTITPYFLLVNRTEVHTYIRVHTCGTYMW